MNLLHGWHTRFRARSEAPWIGPRPMHRDREAPEDLIGRRDDIRDIARLVHDNDVTVLTGAAGVGKTSLLQVGLLPTLRDSGFQVLVCDEWHVEGDRIDVDELLTRVAGSTLSARVRIQLQLGRSLLEALDTAHPDRCVVVLDQFEELMRYRQDVFQDVLRWVEEVAAEHRVRVLLSLRVEHAWQLRGHWGLRAGPFHQAWHDLRPLDDVLDITAIVQRGAARAGTAVVTEAGLTRLLSAWADEGPASGPTARGLVHLQALLVVLWRRRAGACIDATDIDDLWSTRERHPDVDDDAPTAVPVFGRALVLAVGVALDTCVEACDPDDENDWPGLDPVLVTRARVVVRAVSRHLSSGGFKISQSRQHLADTVLFHEGPTALDHELPEVRRARDRLAALVDQNPPVDWLSVTRGALFDVDTDCGPGDDEHLDDDDVTGGVLLGARPADSLLEEYRAFHLALEWLRASGFVRMTAAPEPTMVTLTHDLFGGGLTEWAQRDAGGPDHATHQVAGVRGVDLRLPARPDPAAQRAVVVNIRWRNCAVTAEFRGVTFVNCDFRGTVFRDCLFDGVVFVNCMLDDAEFYSCTVVGTPTSPSAGAPATAPGVAGTRDAAPPSYFLSDPPADVLRSLCWYREPRLDPTADGLGLFSPTAGAPAVPRLARDVPGAEHLVTPAGGLTLFGGRLSSLKFRSCVFTDQGRIALRSVAGTSVEFADQEAAALDVVASALRGLTFTRPVTDRDDPPLASGGTFDLTFAQSVVINLWFGVGLRGSASFADCKVWQVFNAADRDEFTVTIPQPDCDLYGLVNGHAEGEPDNAPTFAPDSLGTRLDDVLQASRTIDYRARPLASELGRSPTEA